MNQLLEIPRSRFLRLLLTGALGAPALTVLGSGLGQLRGDRAGWVRLKTPSAGWMRHSNGDPKLTQFFRDQTSLNIDREWYVADVGDLKEMIKYPFIFSQGIHDVDDKSARANVAEFIRRGGFLLVDACCNPQFTPDFDAFLQQHKEIFVSILPESKLALLPRTHAVYHSHFAIPDGHPPHTFMVNVYDAKKAAHGLYGLMIGQRMAGMVSLSGLQCGWESLVPPAGHDLMCMRMMTNIYVYAMMQGGN